MAKVLEVPCCQSLDLVIFDAHGIYSVQLLCLCYIYNPFWLLGNSYQLVYLKHPQSYSIIVYLM